jgi:hypothetical protein
MSEKINEQTEKMREMAQTTLDKAKDAVKVQRSHSTSESLRPSATKLYERLRLAPAR